MNKRMMIWIVIVLALMITLVSAESQLYNTTNFTLDTRTDCTVYETYQNCTTTLFSQPTFAYENGHWKNRSQASSLKGQGFSCDVIRNITEGLAGSPLAVCYDFNSTHIQFVNITINDTKLPIIIYYPNGSIKSNTTVNVPKNLPVNYTVPIELFEKLHLGANSTTVQLKGSNGKVLFDTYVITDSSGNNETEHSTANNLRVANTTQPTQQYTYVMFDITAVPQNAIILNTTINLFGKTNFFDITEEGFNFSPSVLYNNVSLNTANLTWLNQPRYNGDNFFIDNSNTYKVNNNDSIGEYRAFDMTNASIVHHRLFPTARNITFIINPKIQVGSPSSTDYMDYASSEAINVSESPTYNITYILPNTIIADIGNQTNMNVTTEPNNASHLQPDNTTAPWNSLVAYYQFDADEYTFLGMNKTWDYSGNNLDGQYTGQAIINSSGVGGVYNDYAQFDGINDYINIPDSTVFDMTEITVSAWVKANKYGVVLARQVPAGNTQFTLEAGNNYVAFYINAGASTDRAEAVSTDIGATGSGKWVHLVGTFNGSNQTVYINGVIANHTTHAVTLNLMDQPLIIGKSPTPAWNPDFNGTVDEVMIFNKALTPAQIQAIYNNQSARFYPQGVQAYPFFKINRNETANFANVTVQNVEQNYGSQLGARVGYWNPTLNYLYNDSVVDIWGANGNANSARGLNNGVFKGNANASSEGILNNSFGFDGTGDSINLSDSAGMSGLDTFTVAYWMKTSTSSYGTTISRLQGSGFTNAEWTILGSGGVTYVDIYDSSASGYIENLKAIPTLYDGNWHYFVMSWNGTATGASILMYVDTVLQTGTTPTTSGLVNVDDTDISTVIGMQANGGSPYTGLLDEIMIFNRTLTDDEMKSLYLTGQINHQIGVNWTFSATKPLTSGANGKAVNISIGAGSDYLLPEIVANATNQSRFYSPVWFGNVTTQYYFASLTDAIAPTVTLTAPANNSNFTSEPISINATITDETSLASNSFYVWNNASILVVSNLSTQTGTSALVSFNFTPPYDGRFFWNDEAIDAAGNAKNATNNFTFLYDASAPIITFNGTTPANNSNSTTGAFTINISAAENVSTIGMINLTVYNSGGTPVRINTSTSQELRADITGLTDGIYTYNATSNNSMALRSDTLTRTITVDTTAPVLSFVSPTPSNLNFSSTGAFTINLTGAETIAALDTLNLSVYNSAGTQIRNNNSQGANLTADISGLAEGNYTFNGTGNNTFALRSYTATRKITVDATAPTLAYELPTPANNTIQTSNSFILNVSASDAVSGVQLINVSLYNSGGTLIRRNTSTETPFNLTWTGLADGVYTYNATANDSAGNRKDLGTRTITIDSSPPVMAYLDPTPSSGTYQSSNSFTVNVSAIESGSSLDTINISVYASGSQIRTNTSGVSPLGVNITGLSDGNYSFNATANNSNTLRAYLASRWVVIDSVIPAISFQPSTTQNGSYSQSYISLNISISDLNFDSGTFRLYNSTGSLIYSNASLINGLTVFNKTNLADGNYTFNATATDLAGNTNSTATYRITLDSLFPICTIYTPTAGNKTSKTIEVNASCVDANLANTSLWNGTANQTYLGVVNITYTEDQNVTLIVTGCDTFGNCNTSQVSINIDSTAWGTITSPLNGANLPSGVITFSFTSNETLRNASYWLNSSGVNTSICSSCSTGSGNTILGNGDYLTIFTYTDLLNNSNTEQSIFTISTSGGSNGTGGSGLTPEQNSTLYKVLAMKEEEDKMNFANLMFFVQFILVIGLTLLKVYNVMKLGTAFDIKTQWIIFIGFFIPFVVGLVTNILNPQMLIFSLLFRLEAWLTALFVVLFGVEIILWLKNQVPSGARYGSASPTGRYSPFER